MANFQWYWNSVGLKNVYIKKVAGDKDNPLTIQWIVIISAVAELI